MMDPRPFRSFAYRFLRSGHFSVANVVRNGVVEQRCVLRHDTDGSPQRFQGDFANVLTVDGNFSGLRVVEAEEQTEDGAFSAARGADNGELFAGWDGQGEILENGTVRAVAECHIFEADFTATFREVEGRGVGDFFDGDILFLQVEEGFHVKETLAEFAVDAAEEVEGNGELEDELIDHDEVADGEAPRGDSLGGHVHHSGEGSGEDEVLTGIEICERGGNFDAGSLVVLQRRVVAVGFVRLIVEILDGFVVDERVHRDCGTSVVGGVGLLAEFGSPRGGADGEPGVGRHGADSEGRELPAVLVGKHAGNEGDFEGGRDDVEDHRGEEEANSFGSPINGAGETSSLAREVEGQVQAEEMIKDIARDAANGFLGDGRKYGIAELLGERGADAGRAVCGVLSSGIKSREEDGRMRHTREDCSAGHRHRSASHSGKVNIHRVDNILEIKGDLHIQDLQDGIYQRPTGRRIPM